MSFSLFSSVILAYNDTKYTSRSISNGNSSLQQRITISSLAGSDTEIPTNIKISISNFYINSLVDTSPRSINILVSRSTSNIATGSFNITPTANLLNNVNISADITVVS